MAMKHCPKCKKWVSEHAPTCQHCGAPLSVEMIYLAEVKQRNRFDIVWTLTNIWRFFWDARLVIFLIIAFILLVLLPILTIFDAFER